MREQLEAVGRMQDYIAQHLSEEITPADLARAAHFSPWYSRRLFILHVGITPADYIRRLRLRQSALRLRDQGCSVLDAAMSVGYGSLDGYQRAFRREFGCNPKAYALKPIPLRLFTPYRVSASPTAKGEEAMETIQTVFVQLVEKPARKVIIKRGRKAEDYFAYCAEVGCDVWGVLTSIRSLSGEPVCLYLPDRYMLPGTSRYVQGVEVALDDDTPIPEGFDVITLPAAKYLMFRSEPFREEEYAAAIERVWQAERKYDPSLMGYHWDSQNPRIQLEPRGERGYIELVAVK